jgi:hypothetical protein
MFRLDGKKTNACRFEREQMPFGGVENALKIIHGPDFSAGAAVSTTMLLIVAHRKFTGDSPLNSAASA